MSLKKQMMIFVVTTLLVLLLGTFALNLSNTKQFLQNQLSSHAQDTATSLGLSLSSVAPDDLPMMQTMINAVFDRGYYARIALEDMDGQPLYLQENPKKVQSVPTWFLQWIDLQTPTASALVQSGWMPLGTLSVTSHAGYAYVELWRAFINLLLWFSLAAVVAIVIVIATLKWMLKPLKTLEKQAEAIVKKEYLLQKNLPSTTEFRQVVAAMNTMVQKLKTVFERDAKMAEKLQKMAYQDSVTGLSNRRHFEMLIDTLLDPQHEGSDGLISLVRIQGLKTLNDRLGYKQGDEFMRHVARALTQHLNTPGALFARINGTELTTLHPGVRMETLEKGLQKAIEEIPHFLSAHQASGLDIKVGAVYLDYQRGQSRESVMSALDLAMDQATQQPGNVVYYATPNAQKPVTQNLSKLLETLFDPQHLLLFQQPSYDANGKAHHAEVLVRLRDEEGQVHSAGYFMPSVHQAGKDLVLDRLVLQQLLLHLESAPRASNLGGRLALNLSASTALSRSLDTALQLPKDPSRTLYKRLAFEVNEQLFAEHAAAGRHFVAQSRALEIAIGIDHFGRHFSGFGHLQTIQPDYVKLDAAFSKGIVEDEQTRQYVASLCEMARSLDIDVIAMAVENQEQQTAFAALGVTLFQGYHYGAPLPLEKSDTTP